MNRLVCRLFKHRWQPVMGGATKDSVCMVCLRCRDNGWLIRTDWGPDEVHP